MTATNESLRYFAATIAQMAETLREFGIADAAESLEKARTQIETELLESKANSK